MGGTTSKMDVVGGQFLPSTYTTNNTELPYIGPARAQITQKIGQIKSNLLCSRRAASNTEILLKFYSRKAKLLPSVDILSKTQYSLGLLRGGKDYDLSKFHNRSAKIIQSTAQKHV